MPEKLDLEFSLPSRPRRNRRSDAIRDLIREPYLRPSQIVHPIFLSSEKNVKQPISSLPGWSRLSVEHADREIEELLALGIKSFIVFPSVPEDLKDSVASYGIDLSNFYLEAARHWKEKYPEICLFSDVALDPYSSDGHDGLVKGAIIDNDETLPILAQMSIVQAQAGFDYLGPSDMMDGRVGYMRDALDQAGYTQTGIMSYTAKYASALYGPFRHALDSAPRADSEAPTHKKSYQMDPANRREALREAFLDTQEGADMLMVKPALHYLDIISDLKQHCDLPISAYHVSGECAMLLGAVERGWLDEEAIFETVTCLGRAGTDVLITYVGRQYAQMYKKLYC